MSELVITSLPRIGMDFCMKVTAETGPDQRDACSEKTDVASSPVLQYKCFDFKVEQSESNHPCPACPLVFATTRDLTHHLRGHNSPRSTTDGSGGEEQNLDYSCGVCQKVLSSASSLDRHVLVHSGERPFKCKYCDMAFTTNGNMNRHLRTAHTTVSPSHSYTDTDGSSDSERPLNRRLIQEEYNNNEIAKRNSPELLEKRSPDGKRKCPDYADEADSQRKHKILLSDSRSEIRGGYSESSPQNIYICTICGKKNFETSAILEEHLKRKHHEIPLKCESCNQSFKNYLTLNEHLFMTHFRKHTDLHNSVVGFKDLCFLDFSSENFAKIARAVCEQSLHRPPSGETSKYQCSKCLRAFPCRSALDAHETDCGSVTANREHRINDDQSVRDDFFAGLDLKNKAALVEAKEGKDLADIQSIISVTSGPILQNFSRADASTPDNCKIKQNFGSGSSGTPEYHEEEAQDAFAAEFRKMKLKGEFPCRLCTAIFPNLRALKGHNRAHMNVPTGMPYPCNMCSYSNTDKTTLTRHLRSHNGDRPYECSMCNYAFTTKANCERHVRNRHGKLTREEIKNVLIYHPTEDPNNDTSLERNSPRSLVRDEVRKSLVYPNDRDELPSQLHYPGEIRIKDEAQLRQPRLMGTNHYDKSEMFSRPVPPLEVIYRNDDLDSHKNNQNDRQQHSEEDMDSRSSDGSMSLVNEAKLNVQHQRIQASPMDLKKSSINNNESISTEGSDDAPLDLTMDVLDLSKKATSVTATVTAENNDKESADINGNAEDLSRNHKDFYDTTNQLLLTQALLKAGQVNTSPPALEAFYAKAQMFYSNLGAFQGVGAGILQPYLFNPHLFGQDFATKDRLQKELVRGLQTSGGSLVDPSTSTPNYGVPAFPQSHSSPVVQNHTVNDQNDYMSSKLNKSIAPREKLEPSPSSNSVKMVIKNGVLMPKQKQRRYRTERPFTCEHCSARFTLRSNMERHIKQQHPQHWSSRPRGGHSTRGRPPANPPTLLQNLGQNSSHPQMNSSYPSLMPKLNQSLTTDYNKHAISDQVKYAILAQQLKGNKHEENDTDEDLIIDEESEKNAKEAKEPTERTLSLLRDKLEANIESKSNDDVEMKCLDDVGNKIKKEIEDSNNEIFKKENDRSSKEELIPKTVENSTIKTEKQMDVKEDRNENEDLASVSEILDNASQHYQQFPSQYMSDEEGLVASTSDCNQSGSDEKSDSVNSGNSNKSCAGRKKKMFKKKKKKKKSAYSMAPNRVICPYCQRPFPWTSSLRRHILTHTGQKPYRCMHCELLFTTKSNCDRHLLRKHKASVNKMRRTRSTSSPEVQDSQPMNNNNSNTNINNNQFSMRNVPERPYKCNQCPSSTFATLGNLKKHRSQKHGVRNVVKSRPESPSSEPQSSPQECPQDCLQESLQENHQENQQECPQDFAKQNDQSGYDSQSSGVSENMDNFNVPKTSTNSSANNTSSSANETSRSRRTSPRSSPGPNTESPFKCHLCDSGFSERQDCLDHIKDNHERSYEMLVAKGALDMDIDNDDPMPPQPPPPPPSDGEERRGRFPDYSNRKVVCAFCMRRFWSAEDLRRHMRTHTGERPFSCDICFRRFTLKHSMLRHRKKHESADSSMYVGTSGDEDNAAASLTNSMTQPPTITPRSQHQPATSSGNTSNRASLPQVASVATADAAPSGFNRFNPYEKLTTLTGRLSAGVTHADNDNTDNDNTETSNDLISNLLGIRDKSIIDRVLQAPSADDAAKLLGVKGNNE